VSDEKKNVRVSVTVIDMRSSELKDYSEWLTKYLTEKYADFFTGNIDETKLYAELRYHYVFRNFPLLKKRAASAELDIYVDGSVYDGRWFVELPIKWFFMGGE